MCVLLLLYFQTDWLTDQQNLNVVCTHCMMWKTTHTHNWLENAAFGYSIQKWIENNQIYRHAAKSILLWQHKILLLNTYLLTSPAECSVLKLTDLSVISRHISPAFFDSSVMEIPGNSSLILDLFSFSHRKYADCGLFGLSGSTSFFG